MYLYGMKERGASPGAQPKGMAFCEDDRSGKYYNIISYNRLLSADEVNNYELDYIGEEP